MTKCYLCSSEEFSKRNGTVRDLPELMVIECKSCGLVTLDSFSHIDDNFYEDENMLENGVDLNRWLRDSEHYDKRRFEYLKGYIEDKTVLDFGCGAGGFVRKIREYALAVDAVELHHTSVGALRKEGINVYSNLSDINDKKYDVITLFHVLEHLKDPVSMINDLLNVLEDDGIIIFEVPLSTDALLTQYACKAYQDFIYWSPHLYLFNATTIDLMVRKSDGEMLFQQGIQRYNLTNHLHWLSNGKPGGHNSWFHLNDSNIDKLYEQLLVGRGLNDTMIFGVKKCTNY